VQNRSNGKANPTPNPYAAFRAASVDRVLSFGGVDGNVMRQCVELVTAHGDAILFGRTADGGALSVHILSNGETSKFYVTDASELFELLEGISNVLRAKQ